MKYYRYVEPRDPENDDFSAEIVTLSELEILDYYWDYWYNAMCKKYNKETVDRDYDQDHCLRDWMTVHWAWQVEDHQGEKQMNEEQLELDIKEAGITLDPVEWYRTIVDGKTNTNTPPYSFVPDGVANYLGPVFKGFMISPCAVFENQALTAKTEVVQDLEEFRTKIANIGSLGRPAFLYMVSYIPSQPLFIKVDEQGEVVELDPPETIESGWRIRYSVLGES